MRPVVIYIAGYGRSGSSALSRHLSSTLGVLSAGELGRLPRYIREKLLCSCGKPVDECPVWREARTGKISEAASAAVRAGFDILVDSSKTTYFDFHRPFVYWASGYDVIFVHLIRPIGEVLQAAKKGTNRDLEEGLETRRFLHRSRILIGYLFAHLAAIVCARLFINRLVIKHSDLSRDIFQVSNEILSKAKTDDGCLDSTKKNAFGTHGKHEIAGNRLLRIKDHERN